MKLHHLIALFFAFFALSAGAQQESGSTGAPPPFSEADTDGDGILSEEEAESALPDDLIIVDTNNDGNLNKSEAELALPGLSFDEGSENDPVDEAAYQMMVEAIQSSGQGGGEG